VKTLIVDDSVTMRIMLSHFLTQLGFEVAEAANGAEALRCLQSQPLPELMTLDWNMPVMNGGATLDAIRQNHAFDPIKILIISSETEKSTVEDALKYGTDDYLMKPFSPEALAQKIEILGFNAQVSGPERGES
jgi:two-component system chemotaxis response regulator CheY